MAQYIFTDKAEADLERIIDYTHKSHILYYLKIPQGISIVRVLHESMDSVRYFK